MESAAPVEKGSELFKRRVFQTQQNTHIRGAIGVTKIVTLLLDPMKVIFPRQMRGTGLGQRIHEEFGFTNRTSVSRIVGNWKIIGIPDRLEEDAVGDLKTFRTEEEKAYLLTYAKIQTQIYAFLAGVLTCRIYFYNTVTRKITDVIEFPADYELALNCIETGIRRYEKLLEALEVMQSEPLREVLEVREEES